MADPKKDVDDAEKTGEEYVEKVDPTKPKPHPHPDGGSGGNSPHPHPPSPPPPGQ